MSTTQSILTLREVREFGPPLNDILDAVSKTLRIGRLDLISTHRARHLTEARQMFYWFARHHTARSFPEIGRFIRRDHATVMHGVRKVDRMLPHFWPRIKQIANTLGVDLSLKEAA